MIEQLVGKILSCEQELITVASAVEAEDGFAVRLVYHPNGVLGNGVRSASQIIPFEAVDQVSIEVLTKFCEDSKNFVYVRRSEGGNVYTLRLVEGYIRFDETVERTNPTNGSPVLGFGSFTHSKLKIRRLGATPAESRFDPNLGLTAPAPAPAAPAPAKAAPAPAKAAPAAKRR